MSKDKEFKPQGLRHGGRVLAAVEKYNISKQDWIDLSTGLNPNGWPIPQVPAEVWQALPEDNDGLQTVACEYYGCDACLPVPGSQAAIQTLPALRSRSKVGVISPTYAEHEYNWKQAGHNVIQLKASDVENQVDELDVLVVINPNNPTGELISIKQLLSWHQRLSSRGGWLIVDEAFMDVTPENSLIPSGIKPGLVILRSIGKFFGIAGIRCGFVISDNELLQRLAKKMGPWALTGPTRYIAKQALIDIEWHKKTRSNLIESSRRLSEMLSQFGLNPKGSTSLFQWVEHPKSNEIYEAFANKGILIRLFETHTNASMPSLRFGLPATENQWKNLSRELKMLTKLTIKKMKANYV